ncbi:hypothetical protein [Staphylococcus kloosii]|uniref:Uncharacterized protein n=1 Tax=Staphylococcus kloosii TaxID=29384 RepID=A0ABQ0XSB5_9STAP|nr:hypothetical protein [Staphylococcus kloosii]AVQ35803.1 hypothetical protein C7J89_06555 [Staphylococcus kloosii]PNZ05422.1 hypothetical protein CD136_07140 [Staphylococcus kloosii]GEP82570.1 hypothetical protein SKL01_17480 [Staphylococcus kloosii]SUM48872.1 Uncharacterised protein [Staphylococcus kloosii]
MSKEVPIVFMQDPRTGENFYVQTDISAVDGMPDDFADYDLGDIQDNVSTINNSLGTVQSQINSLQSQINSLVTDTGWQNIKLNNGITAYSSSETPKARLISVNGVSFLSLKGALKGLTATGTIGTLPTTMTAYVSDSRGFVQNTTKVSNTLNFARWRVQTNGNIDLEGATQSTIDSTHWFPIGTTLML